MTDLPTGMAKPAVEKVNIAGKVPRYNSRLSK
jgi:hypothetical protein